MNLTQRKQVETPFDVRNVIISKSHNVAVSLCQASDDHYCINVFDTDSHQIYNEININGTYIRAKDLSENIGGYVF